MGGEGDEERMLVISNVSNDENLRSVSTYTLCCGPYRPAIVDLREEIS